MPQNSVQIDYIIEHVARAFRSELQAVKIDPDLLYETGVADFNNLENLNLNKLLDEIYISVKTGSVALAQQNPSNSDLNFDNAVIILEKLLDHLDQQIKFNLLRKKMFDTILSGHPKVFPELLRKNTDLLISLGNFGGYKDASERAAKALEIIMAISPVAKEEESAKLLRQQLDVQEPRLENLNREDVNQYGDAAELKQINSPENLTVLLPTILLSSSRKNRVKNYWGLPKLPKPALRFFNKFKTGSILSSSQRQAQPPLISTNGPKIAHRSPDNNAAKISHENAIKQEYLKHIKQLEEIVKLHHTELQKLPLESGAYSLLYAKLDQQSKALATLHTNNIAEIIINTNDKLPTLGMDLIKIGQEINVATATQNAVKQDSYWDRFMNLFMALLTSFKKLMLSIANYLSFNSAAPQDAPDATTNAPCEDTPPNMPGTPKSTKLIMV